ncbi:hypothetical protein ES703_89690 [subsurface metagenome]
MLVAQTTPDTGGVVNKAFFMEDADKFMLKVIPAPMDINQFAVVAGAEVNSHGIDGEVAARKVAVNRAGLHCGQGSGLGVGLRAGGD